MSGPSRSEGPYPARVPSFIEKWSRGAFFVTAGAALVATAALSLLSPWAWLLLAPLAIFTVVGIRDIVQTRHAIRRNFPVIGHARYILESLRPELRQYFVESDTEQNPFSREKRSIIYQRAKNQLDTQPFGTRQDVNAVGYEWINHSLTARQAAGEPERVPIGGAACARPYSASLLNVSAMSYGSLGRNAVLALNGGARAGGFFHNTGEGGISPYHLEPGGDLAWQIGTGYFGCRAADGGFDEAGFVRNATRASVKLIELKLSQGAKPGHGGILPARKVTPEIAEIRGVTLGQDVVSPPAHRAFATPVEMMVFLDRLRELSGGRPVGFKLCVGERREFMALVRGMLETGVFPDFITVDGTEGGTGAAPLEFANSVGTPLREGLTFVHDALVAAGVRDRVRIVSAGKIATGFHVVRQLALGADLCASARGMMFALGCIQALMCNTNHCPVGVATQDRRLQRGLDVGNKAERVRLFHLQTVEAVHELLAAAGLGSATELGRQHVYRRVAPNVIRSFAEIYPVPEPGSLLRGEAPEPLQAPWVEARADRF